VSGVTIRYYHPLRYIFVMAGLSALIATTVDFKKILKESSAWAEKSMTPEAVELQVKSLDAVLSYMSLFYLSFMPLMSIGSFLVFRKKGYNFAEHLVGNSYLFGHLALFSIFITNLYRLPMPIFTVSFINIAVVTCYSCWFYKSWFSISWPQTLVRTFLTLLMGYLFIGIMAGVISVIWQVLFS
jgi:hypothetical protein